MKLIHLLLIHLIALLGSNHHQLYSVLAFQNESSRLAKVAANAYISVIVLHGSINPYAIAICFVLAALTWLGMSIAHGAIRTARKETQKNAAILNGVADEVVALNDDDQVVLANPVTLVRDVSRQVEDERARDAMLDVVCHEMWTPLAAIIGFAEVSALRTDMAPQMAERIRVNAQRLTYMVNDLLDHAQMQSSALKVRNEPFSPASSLLVVRNLLSGLAEQKSLKLITEIDPALPVFILGDPSRIQQILVNLLGNAIEFTDFGEVCVSFRAYDQEWQMIVQDSGMGNPAEQLPDIFEPFRRGADDATREYQGVRLRLSIVKNLVTLMEGTIEVQSTVGQGSVFTVTLPLKKVND